MRIATGIFIAFSIFGITAAMPAEAADLTSQGSKLLKTILPGSSSKAGLSNSDMIGGLKDALSVGTSTVVAQLSKINGFNKDKKIHIPLPPTLEKTRSIAKTFGLDSDLKKLELQMNRGAEQATKVAKPLFVDAISNLTFADAKKIVNAPDDAATRYFRKQMHVPLRRDMRPIVKKSLNEVGAFKAYEDLANKYRGLPLAGEMKFDMVGYVLDKGLDGIFHYVAEEEKSIRHNPAKRTTELLRKVFSN